MTVFVCVERESNQNGVAQSLKKRIAGHFRVSALIKEEYALLKGSRAEL